MSAVAVAALATLARGEFERDWRGAERLLEHLDGVRVVTCTVGEVVHRFDAPSLAATIEAIDDDLRDELEESDEILSEEETTERVRAEAREFWISQLETDEEQLAAFEAQVTYLLEGFNEYVALCDMLMARQPALTDRLMASKAMVLGHLLDLLTP